MFKSRKKMKQEERHFIELLNNFVLKSNIKEREKKIGLMAKKDIENKKYILAVVNKISSSMEQEAMKNGLSKEASLFYKQLSPIITTLSPIGLNRGSTLFNNSYLE